jgi:Ni,Fe-hydrogenase III component G
METLTIKRQSTRTFSVKEWLNRKNDFYSSLVGEQVSNLFVIKTHHALIAFLSTAVAANCSIFALLICLLWFFISIRLCKGSIQ